LKTISFSNYKVFLKTILPITG